MQETELSLIYSRANSKGFFLMFSFLANPSTLLTKKICTFAMIHLIVKQIRYKYRYGCNMKSPQKTKTKPKKPNLGVWGPCV